jgi:hypothetical protein
MTYDMQAEGLNGVSDSTVIGANDWLPSTPGAPILRVDATSNQVIVNLTALECKGSGGGAGVLGQGSAGPGVLGESQMDRGVFGKSNGANGVGVKGECAAGVGVFGVSENQQGVIGQSTGGSGVFGLSTNNVAVLGTSSTGSGVLGLSQSSFGVFGEAAGFQAGVAGIGKRIGVNGAPVDPDGVGVAGFSPSFLGVSGFTINGTAVSGVVTVGPPFPANSFAGHFVGPVHVNGPFTVTGTKSAAVPHPDGSTRLLFSLECPESWFEDFGKRRLSKGTTQITIDPDFAAVVDAKECHVFLTPYGDCNGLYVDGLTETGFVVREHKGGTSNVEFSYRLVAKRKDIKDERLPKISLPSRPPETERLESPRRRQI